MNALEHASAHHTAFLAAAPVLLRPPCQRQSSFSRHRKPCTVPVQRRFLPVTAVQTGTEPPSPTPPKSSSFYVNPVALTACAVYFSNLFIFPPTPNIPAVALREALQLSLNFAFLVPLAFPASASVLHPYLEAIFHVVVAWAVLLTGFAALDITQPDARPKATPFLLGALLLTNIFYLPFLALRRNSEPRVVASLPALPIPDARPRLVAFAESRLPPAIAGALFVAATLWAVLARGDAFSPDAAVRLAEFARLAFHDDILAFSFVADVAVFSLFQAALVGEDAASRQWDSHQVRRRAELAARYLPFFGLCYYLWERASRAPLPWGSMGGDVQEQDEDVIDSDK